MRGSVGIVLTYEESPQALLSFDFFNTFMRIYQNKGIKPILYFDQDADYFSDSVGLRQIKSNTKLMYDIAIDIAGKMELEKVEIISAKNRPDFNSGLLDDRLMWQIFKTCDVLPFDMGFEEKDDGNWVKYFNESELFFKSLKN